MLWVSGVGWVTLPIGIKLPFSHEFIMSHTSSSQVWGALLLILLVTSIHPVHLVYWSIWCWYLFWTSSTQCTIRVLENRPSVYYLVTVIFTSHITRPSTQKTSLKIYRFWTRHRHSHPPDHLDSTSHMSPGCCFLDCIQWTNIHIFYYQL